MTAKIRGVVPPIITPLTAAGELDVPSFERLLSRQLEAGVDGLFLLGSSGEVAFSNDAKRRQVLEAGVKYVAGQVPVLAGVIDTQTDRVLDHVRAAEAQGVDAVVATAPFYALGGPEVTERHFRVLGAASEVPVYAYDIPVCVHTKLNGQMLLELGSEGLIAGVKDSSGDDVAFRFLARANEKAGSPLSLLTGHEVVVDGAYMSGADGSVPGLANVAPEPYVRQWRAYQAGDWEAVRREQDYLADLMRIVTVTQGVSGYSAGVGAFKTALQLLGVISTNQMPVPAAALQGENVSRIAAVLREAELLDS
ncbi:dihydrodipicolinate synthase family protein [Canibacter oris]|uniref:4-hydroxy-tetrahydrodipicolinate synthase n=1 Tax=Canibacter oris TaxID=1365628 RepID=A0A840DF65_9MICO|nr:dihydrodipicolinate synthase family protein [Canibacter oris]MBB4071714.1 4-hydroxy-tetrahydrodipicolinate synthase [Canibacter oris]